MKLRLFKETIRQDVSDIEFDLPFELDTGDTINSVEVIGNDVHICTEMGEEFSTAIISHAHYYDKSRFSEETDWEDI